MSEILSTALHAGSVKSSVVAQELYQPEVQQAVLALGTQADEQLAPLRNELLDIKAKHDRMTSTGPLTLNKLQDRVRDSLRSIRSPVSLLSCSALHLIL